MELVIAYLAVNIVAGLVACLFGRRLFYAVLGVLVFLGVFNVALASTDGAPLSLAIAAATIWRISGKSTWDTTSRRNAARSSA